MPGICGTIDLRPESERPPLATMIAPLRPHGWFVSETSEELPGASLAAVSLDRASRMPHLARSACGRQVCVLDGEIYNAAELRREFPREEAEEDSDAALLLAGWNAEGKSFLRKLNGSFAAVVWDEATSSAVIIADRFGNRPLYYARIGQRLLFSSRIKSLMADDGVTPEINPRGLAQFFTFGHYLRDDTSLRDVHLLEAAACCTWNARTGVWNSDTYYRWTDSIDSADRSTSDWIRDIGDAFYASVQLQTRGTKHLGLSLSGGLDARSVLAAIDIAKTPLQTICLGMRGSLDHRCAEKLAKIAGCANHSHVLDTKFLGDFRQHLDRMIGLTDGQYLSQCIVMPTLPVYRQLGIEVLLRGHAGELMHMYKAYNYSLDEEALALPDEMALENWLFGRLQAYMLDGVERPIFAPRWQRELGELARQSLHADVADTAGARSAPQRIWQLFLMQRARRETVLSLNKFRSVAETRLPFLDNNLVSLLLAAPPQLKLGEEIQAAILKRFRPEFLQVVNANTGTRVGAGPWTRKWSSLYLRAMGKLGVPGYQPYERLGLWLRRELAGVVCDVLLSDETLDRGLYDADGIRAVVGNHLAGRNHTYLIMALMVFELGQRYLEVPTRLTETLSAVSIG